MRSILLGLIAILTIIVVGCGNGVNGNAVANSGNVIENSATGGNTVSIPLADLSGTAKFYEYNDRGVKVKYFAVLGSDGVPRTAFDACDVCGGYKGYQQIGDDIKCRNCGRVFSIDGLGTKNKGYGCWPSFLPHTVQGDSVIINIKDIQKGRAKFA